MRGGRLRRRRRRRLGRRLRTNRGARWRSHRRGSQRCRRLFGRSRSRSRWSRLRATLADRLAARRDRPRWRRRGNPDLMHEGKVLEAVTGRGGAGDTDGDGAAAAGPRSRLRLIGWAGPRNSRICVSLTSQQPACEPAADPSPEVVPSRASLPVPAVLPVGTRQTLRPGEPRMAGAARGLGRCGCMERSGIRRPWRAPPRQCSSSSAEHRAGAGMAPMHVTAHPVPRQAAVRPRRGGTPLVPPLSRKPQFGRGEDMRVHGSPVRFCRAQLHRARANAARPFGTQSAPLFHPAHPERKRAIASQAGLQSTLIIRAFTTRDFSSAMVAGSALEASITSGRAIMASPTFATGPRFRKIRALSVPVSR